MSGYDDKWEDQYYMKIYTEEMEYLTVRRDMDEKFTPEYLRLMLKELYQSQGDGCIGKEAINELRMSAKISAYESFVVKWEEELEEADKNKNKPSESQ